MISVKFQGRLANNLFQWASCLGIADKLNTYACFAKFEHAEYFENAPQIVNKILPTLKEKVFHYDINQFKDGYCLDGYFQSAKYFDNIDKSHFRFKQSVLDKLPKFNKKTIGIHVRRGDYVNNPNYVNLPITYYLTALFKIKNWKDYQIVICTDDTYYCQTHFECLDAYISKGSAIEDLALLSTCDYLILSNSSFSWWGAYLSNAKVFHSGKLFAGELSNNDIKDFYLPEWEAVKYDRLDFSDVTFTIPISYDHPDRKQNIELSIAYLQHNFNCNIIVGEQGGNKFEYLSETVNYVKFDSDAFHRTAMLNTLADLANTPILFNYDADVIVPIAQLWKAVDMMRKGVDFALPFDGRFCGVPRTEISKLNNYDCGSLQGKDIPNMLCVSGCVGVLKKSFIEAGGENENFVSYAPEDVERKYRFEKLGYNVQRIKGRLFHIEHWRGKNSGNKHEHFKYNESELKMIHRLSPEQIKERVRWNPKQAQMKKANNKKIIVKFDKINPMTFKINPDKKGVKLVFNNKVIVISSALSQDEMREIFNNPKHSHLIVADGLPKVEIKQPDVIVEKKKDTTTSTSIEQPKEESDLSNQPEVKELKRRGRKPKTA